MTGSTIIATWLLSAWSAWVPATDDARPFREGMARDILAVAYDPAEPPLFPGPQGRARTALVMARVAALESQLRPDVDVGHCRPTECDHGTAFCPMQVRPAAGIVLDGTMYDYASRRSPAWRRDHAAEIVNGERLVDDRRTCFRVALHMLRASRRHTGGLGEYTGERAHGPLARNRWEGALVWATRHELDAADAQVAADLPRLLESHDVVRAPR